MGRSPASLERVVECTLHAVQDPQTSADEWDAICEDWVFYLDLCRWNSDQSVDWGAARILFQARVPEETMRDEKFRYFMTALFMLLCGADEGFDGAKRVFDRYPG